MLIHERELSEEVEQREVRGGEDGLVPMRAVWSAEAITLVSVFIPRIARRVLATRNTIR